MVLGQLDAAAPKSFQSCPTQCDPINGSPPGSPVPGILQARTLEWVAIFSSNARKWKVKVKSLSRVRLLVTSWTAAYQTSIHGIFQARVLEWGAIAFSNLIVWMHCNPVCCCCSVVQSYLTLWSHGLQHNRLPCPSLSPGVCSNSCPLSRWCHPTIFKNENIVH